MNRFLYLTLFIILHINGNAQISLINVFKAINEKHNVYLSELTDRLTYIQLSDENQTVLIGKISIISASHDYIVIYDKSTNKILLFGSDGTFKKSILNWGKGPGEYNVVNSIDINENNEILILADWNHIFVVNTDGKITRNFSINGHSPLTRWISDEIFVSLYFHPFYITNNGNEITFYNMAGKVLKTSIHHSIKNISYNDMMPRFSSGWNNDTLYYWNAYHDTVFYITKKMEVAPRIILINNSKQYPIKELQNGAKMANSFNTNNYYVLDDYFELGDYALIQGVYKQCHVFMVIDRRTGGGSNIFEDYSLDHFRGITNDVDGGSEFVPFSSSMDGTLLMPLDPNELRETYLKNEKIGKHVKYPKEQEILGDKIIRKIKMMDNPIILKINKQLCQEL